MKKLYTLGLLCTSLLVASVILAFNTAEEIEYKCMVQLTNYSGEGAYVVVSLIDPEGNYDRTLYMMGEDEKWYDYFKQWWAFWEEAQKPSLDAITGESIIGGDRKMIKIKIDPSKIDAGYKIRFESAVEDQEYYAKDAEVDLSAAGLKAKVVGSGYIRYVRFLPSSK